MVVLPSFTGKVLLRDDSEEYKAHTYQYATTSYPDGTFAPAFVLFAATEEDVSLAIDYARTNDLAIAIRSGGHSYLGSSSTQGRNIQIDLSGRGLDDATCSFRQWSIDELSQTLTLGVGLAVDDLNQICLQKGIFFPHGECKSVHVGGHVHTGGFSIISCTFGTMIDHVESFDIFLADGSKRHVRKDSSDPLDQALWFGVLGGGPGSFGIVTRVTVRYYRDVDHPKTRGLKLAWPMSMRTLETLTQLISQLNDDKHSDPDFHFSVIAVGAEPRWSLSGPMPQTLDDHMSEKHPELVGTQDFHWRLPMLALGGCWANSKGAAQDDSHVDEVFERFRSVPGRIPTWLLRNVLGDKTAMDGDQAAPMSTIFKNLTWENPRVMQLSYRKLVFFGKSRSLAKANKRGITFAQWLVSRVQEIEGLAAQFTKSGLRLGVQAGLMGGPGLANPPRRTAMGNRDGVYWFAYDIFYNPKRAGAEAAAEAHIEAVKNDILSGDLNFWDDGKERRLLTGPIREKGASSLDEQWHLYYDSREDYERLLDLKARIDPHHVFTANVFSVGATRCARLARQHEAAPPTAVYRAREARK